MTQSETNYYSSEFCLITGGAGGLGLELAKIFAMKGYSLILIDKNEVELEKTKSFLQKNYPVQIIAFNSDLSRKKSAVTIYNKLTEQGIAPQILINNAGFGYFGRFAENNWKGQQQMINLSVVSSTHLIQLFLPHMIHHHKGHILNVASLAAFMPGPLMSVYHASKSFLLSFSLALAEELKGTGVNVTVLCPGMMATGFQKANNNEKPRMSWTLTSAEKVAWYCYRKMQTKKVVVVPGIMNQLLSNLPRMLPLSVTSSAVMRIQLRNRNNVIPA